MIILPPDDTIITLAPDDSILSQMITLAPDDNVGAQDLYEICLYGITAIRSTSLHPSM